MTDEQREDQVATIVDAVEELALAVVEDSKASDLGPDYWEHKDYCHERRYDKANALKESLNAMFAMVEETINQQK